MPPVSKRQLKPEVEEKIFEILIEAIGKVGKKHDVVPFLSDLLYVSERTMVAKRLAIAFLLLRGGYDYRQIADTLKVSTTTISRVNLVLNTQGTGYRKVVEKLLKEKALRLVLYELYEALTPLPPKGANWGEWKKERRKRREKLASF